MSVLGKSTKEEVKKSAGWKKLLLPGYIIFSAIFIVYSLYTYFGGVVYQAWVNQWINSAVVRLMQQAGSQCEQPVSLTAWGQQVDVINVACLQQPQSQVQAPAPEPAPVEETPAEGQ